MFSTLRRPGDVARYAPETTSRRRDFFSARSVRQRSRPRERGDGGIAIRIAPLIRPWSLSGAWISFGAGSELAAGNYRCAGGRPRPAPFCAPSWRGLPVSMRNYP